MRLITLVVPHPAVTVSVNVTAVLPQASVAVATPVTLVSVVAGHSSVRSVGTVSTGGVVSFTVRVWSAVATCRNNHSLPIRLITLVPHARAGDFVAKIHCRLTTLVVRSGETIHLGTRVSGAFERDISRSGYRRSLGVGHEVHPRKEAEEEQALLVTFKTRAKVPPQMGPAVMEIWRHWPDP